MSEYPSAGPGSVAATRLQHAGLQVDVAFERLDAGRLSVRYAIENAGTAPMAIFDRGNVHAILTKQQSAGAVGQPRFRVDGGDLTLSHTALPLPDPAPTSPPTPVAARLAPGERLQGQFDADLTLADDPQRVRWCLGVAPFSEDDFMQARDGNGVDLWTASFAMAERQQQLCTPWFDLRLQRFES